MATVVAPIQETFGERVRERRLALGMTQAELAEKMGMYQPDISTMESGRSTPNLTTVERAAKALKVTPDFFFKP